MQPKEKQITMNRPILRLNFGPKTPESLLNKLNELRIDSKSVEETKTIRKKNKEDKKLDLNNKKSSTIELKSEIEANFSIKPNGDANEKDTVVKQIKIDKSEGGKTDQNIHIKNKIDSKEQKENKDLKTKTVKPRKWLLDPKTFKEMLKDFKISFPNCFSEEKKPLALNIRGQLKEKKFEYSNSKISLFLNIYCRNKGYRKNLTLGAERVDLDGEVSSYVTEEQIEKGKSKSNSKSKLKSETEKSEGPKLNS